MGNDDSSDSDQAARARRARARARARQREEEMQKGEGEEQQRPQINLGTNDNQSQSDEEDNNDDNGAFDEFYSGETFDPESYTVYEQLYLRSPKYAARWVYLAELERSITLVVVTSNHNHSGARGEIEERERLDSMRNTLRGQIRNYAAYLITKEHTHLPALTYLQQFPGLVHFIFVNRTSNRVIAPTISSLYGTECAPSEEEAKRMARMLKKAVWDMCYKAQQQLALGYYSMTMKCGIFQLSYRLWVEDSDFEQPFTHENRMLPSQHPHNYRFYRKLLRKLFPGRGDLRLYELYTLYLGCLSLESVTHYDRNLASLLKK